MVYIVLYLNVIVFPEKSSGKRMINNAQMFNCNSNLSISYYILTFRQYLHPSILVVEVRRARFFESMFLSTCSTRTITTGPYHWKPSPKDSLSDKVRE